MVIFINYYAFGKSNLITTKASFACNPNPVGAASAAMEDAYGE